MEKPILHFVHGNSFPTGTYSAFLSPLRLHYDVRALEMHAHHPAYPVQDGWHALMHELIDELALRYTGPVILVGHSMGGMLSLMTASARPDLVRCVVLLDAPVVAGWRALLLRVAKVTGADRRFGPARLSQRRCHVWPNAQAAYSHYAAKPMFAAWPQQVLRDYVEHGMVVHSSGVTLRFTREAETAIYRSLPHHLGKMVRHPFPVPVGFVGGTRSAECRMAGLAATRRLVGKRFRTIPGGHLFPMESPDIAADAVHAMIQSMLFSK